MMIVVQRVIKANIIIENQIYNSINQGALLLLGVHNSDTKQDAKYLAKKINNLRFFNDENQKMNQNINQIEGSLLVVSQFTLYGDLSKGNRPSFINAMRPKKAKILYDYFIDLLKINKNIVKTGKFGANMQVQLINDGPVTLILESKS